MEKHDHVTNKEQIMGMGRKLFNLIVRNYKYNISMVKQKKIIIWLSWWKSFAKSEGLHYLILTWTLPDANRERTKISSNKALL